MLRSRKHAGKFNTNCYFGCCPTYPSKKAERRAIKRKENVEWKKNLTTSYRFGAMDVMS